MTVECKHHVSDLVMEGFGESTGIVLTLSLTLFSQSENNILIKKSQDYTYWILQDKALSVQIISERTKFERKYNRQNLGNVCKHELRQEINRKLLPTILNVPIQVSFTNTKLQMDYHTEGNWLIHYHKHHKENQLLSLEHSCWLFLF